MSHEDGIASPTSDACLAFFNTERDIADMFADEREQMFFTLVHLTDLGYLRIAERIHETLRGAI